jgi:hypothetical protein
MRRGHLWSKNFRSIFGTVQTYVEMIDRTTAGRNQMNSFYISLLSGLLAFISIATNKDIVNLKLPNFPAIAVLAVAIYRNNFVLCVASQHPVIQAT